MTDPIVNAALTTAGKIVDPTAEEAARTASNLLSRLLGPTADVIGADWADRLRRRNLKRLLDKTQKRADAETEPGFTTPRLAAASFEAAQYAEDEIVAEYLSGVLASSRAPDGGDDAGLPWTDLVRRLSTLQLKFHFVVYGAARPLLIEEYEAIGPVGDSGDEPEPPNIYDVMKSMLVLPLDDVLAAIGLDSETGLSWNRLEDTMNGLRREGLLAEGFRYGDREFFEREENRPLLKWPDHKQKKFVPPFDPALRVALSPYGVRLFLWGMGRGDLHTAAYLDPEIELQLADDDRSLEVRGAVSNARAWEDEVRLDPEPEPRGTVDDH